MGAVAWLASLLALQLLSLAPAAHAQSGPGRQGQGGFGSSGSFEGPFQVVADEVEYDAAREVYVARGHVVVTQEQKTLTADRVFFGDRSRIGVASGNVVLTEAGDTLHADFIEFDVEDMTGVVFEGRLESTGSEFEMTGAEVEKTGDQTYRFEDGRFTTCRCPEESDRDPWALKAGQADLEIEGYAKARNTTMEVLGVPVFWAPYLVLPLKRERQTGFLFPDGGVSQRNGFELSIPFFWAARDNVNVLLDPEYLTKRGFKPAAEIEYVFDKRGAGQLYGTFIHDNDVDRSDPATPFSPNRWGAQWRHVMDLPAASWLAVDGTYIADNQMPFDFDDFAEFRADRYLNSRALSGTRFGPSDAFWGEIALLSANDLQNPNDQDRDELLLQRLPEVSWSAAPGPVPFLRGLLASADVQYVNFQPYGDPTEAIRRLRVGDFFYDTGEDAIPTGQERNGAGVKVPFDAHRDDGRTEGDGRFQEGEPLADSGSRLVAHPRLAYPVRIADAVELYPEIGWYGTFYDTQRVGTETRNLLTSRVDLRSRLRGLVDLPLGIGPTRHYVEPQVSWVFVSAEGQGDNPFLVPTTAVPQDRLRQLALDNLILDPTDRLDEVNSVVVGVNNRLLGQDLGRLFAEFGISSEYRFEGQQWGPLIVYGDGRFPNGWWTRFHISYDVEDNEAAEGLASFGWAHPFGHAANLRYRYIRDIPRFFEAFQPNNDDRFNEFSSGFVRVNQVSAFGRVQLTRQWAVTYLGSYSFENALSLVQQFGVEYLSRCRCWAVRFQVENDRVRGLAWNVNYRLFGLGDDRDRPFSRATGRRFDVF